MPLEFTISPCSEEDLLSVAEVEQAAFSGALIALIYGPSRTPSIAAARHLHLLKTDASSRYMKASLPSGEVIGLAKWNFYDTAGPHYPWPMEKELFSPDANMEFARSFFGSLDKKRNEVMVPKGRGHVYMAILGISPKYQRMGVGRKLLEWGLEKADREGLEVWIEASPAGKGLYEKMGWKELGVIDVDLGRWGGKEGKVDRTVIMLREVKTEA